MRTESSPVGGCVASLSPVGPVVVVRSPAVYRYVVVRVRYIKFSLDIEPTIIMATSIGFNLYFKMIQNFKSFGFTVLLQLV